MKKSLAIVLIISFLITLCGCSLGGGNLGTLELEMNSTPKKLDPLLANSLSEKQIVSALFEGLIRLSEKGEILPASAEKYEVSDDGMTYTFHLRDGLLWSDKKALYAEDFVFGMRRAVSPETGSSYSSQLTGITNAEEIINGEKSADTLGVTATDEKTLVITLKTPDKNLLRKLAGFAAMPCRKDFFDSCGGRYGMAGKFIISNAAYRITGWVDDYDQKKITLRQSSSYKGDFPATLAGVNIDFKETTERTDRLTKGKINAAQATPQLINSADSYGLSSLTYQQKCLGLIFNTENKYFRDADLTTALALAVDRESYKDHLPGSYNAAYTLVEKDAKAAALPYNAQNEATVPAFDVAAGSEHFSAHISKEKKVLPEFTIIFDDSSLKTALSYIVQSWQKQYGIYAVTKEVSSAELSSAVSSGSYEIALTSFTPSDNEVYSMLGIFSSSGRFGNMAPAEYDGLLQSAAAEQDDSSAQEKYLSAEKMLLSDGRIIPLAFTLDGFIYDSSVKRIEFYPDNAFINLTSTEVKYQK